MSTESGTGSASIVETCGPGTGRGESGFSLIEALLTTVVLSVGLLGLGQLQARLWLGSGELHTAETAALVGANILEVTPVEWFNDRNRRSIASAREPLISAEIRRSRPASPGNTLTTTRVDLRWTSPSGERFLSLQKTSATGLAAGDTRWLMRLE